MKDMTHTNAGTGEKTRPASRRQFLKGGLIAAGGTAASTLAAPAVLAQAPIVIKMQTSWPSGDIWMERSHQDRPAARGRRRESLPGAGCHQ